MFIFVIDSHYIKKTPHFPEIEKAIKEAVNEFEGALFPKLNWSAPRVNNKTTLFLFHTKKLIIHTSGCGLDCKYTDIEMHFTF